MKKKLSAFIFVIMDFLKGFSCFLSFISYLFVTPIILIHILQSFLPVSGVERILFLILSISCISSIISGIVSFFYFLFYQKDVNSVERIVYCFLMFNVPALIFRILFFIF